MPDLFDTLTDTTGHPVADAVVKLELLAAADFRRGEGFVGAVDTTIVRAGTARTDATGKYTFEDVTPNANINPAGTSYRVSASSPLGTECWLIVVPDLAGPLWVGDLVTVPVGEPSTVVQGPPGPPGPQGPGMTQADADARYVNLTGDTMTGNLQVAQSLGVDGFVGISAPQTPAFQPRLYMARPDAVHLMDFYDNGSLVIIGGVNCGDLQVSVAQTPTFTQKLVMRRPDSSVIFGIYDNGNLDLIGTVNCAAPLSAGNAVTLGYADGRYVKGTPRLTVSTTAPGSPATGDVWIDNSGAASVVKTWTGSAWK